jgi:hypothetical protein
MKLYDVNNTTYLESDEFKDIVDFAQQVKHTRAVDLQEHYPEYRIRARYRADQDISYSFLTHNIPFYDIPCEVLLHQNIEGYLEINEWHFQLNCFLKSMFHRHWWSQQDAFLNFVYSDWKTKQSNNEFDLLEEQAFAIFEECPNLLEYHKRFIYNQEIQMVSLENVRALFNGLITSGLIIGGEQDVYQVYAGIEYDDADTNVKRKFHAGLLSKMDVLYIKSKFKAEILPKLQSLKTKFNFVPQPDIGTFEGMWLTQKLNNQIWFIPQFLVFYN